jgi:hypothetical protein
MNDMNTEELSEIVRAALKGLEDGKLTLAEGYRVSAAAELVLSGRAGRGALATLRGAYEKIATPYEG